MSWKSVGVNRRIQQVVQSTTGPKVDSWTMLAIQSIQAQLSSLRNAVNAAQQQAGSSNDSYAVANALGDLRPLIIEMTNKSAGALYNGDVVVYDVANPNAVTTTTTGGDDSVIGAIGSDAKTRMSGLSLIFISAVAGVNSAVGVNVGGRGNVRVNTVGARPIAIGDLLKPDITARHACRAIEGETGVFARALQPMSAEHTEVVIDALILPPVEQPNEPEGQPFVFVLNYDTDGSATGFSGFLMDETYYRDATLSTKIRAEHHHYSANGNVVSTLISAFNVDGSGSHMINQTMEYQAGLLSKIIQDLQG